MTIAGSTPSSLLPRMKPLKRRLGRTRAFARSTNPRRIHDFFLTRDKSRLPRSPWLHDRVNPELAKAMSHA
jgi:hypothetical protein